MRSEAIEVTVAWLARFGYGGIEIKGEPDPVRHGMSASYSPTTA